MERSLCLILFVCVIAAALALPRAVIPCTSEVTKCSVSNVSVDPCPLKGGACLFHMGEDATISFDITPEFSATKLKNEVSYNSIAFQVLDKNACLHTSCPVTAGSKSTVSYTLPIRKRETALGRFQIKWKVWNEDDPTDLCCFETVIKIEKAKKVQPTPSPSPSA